MIAIAHDAVATHAYFTWEAEGRPHGRHERHWFAAESALARVAAPTLAEAAPVQKSAAQTPPVKAPAAKKAAAPKKAAAARKAAAPKAADKAPTETVVAAAALAAPRAARSNAKGARRAH